MQTQIRSIYGTVVQTVLLRVGFIHTLYTSQVFMYLCSSTVNESSALDYFQHYCSVTKTYNRMLLNFYPGLPQYSLMCTYMYIWHDSTSEEFFHFHMASFDCHIQWSHLRKEENTADRWTRWLTVRRANLLHYLFVYLLFVCLFCCLFVCLLFVPAAMCRAVCWQKGRMH